MNVLVRHKAGEASATDQGAAPQRNPHHTRWVGACRECSLTNQDPATQETCNNLAWAGVQLWWIQVYEAFGNPSRGGQCRGCRPDAAGYGRIQNPCKTAYCTGWRTGSKHIFGCGIPPV